MIESRKPLTYKVYERVYADIINGTITSNDILTEGALVEQLQVSKSPVREALILLCGEDVLQAIPRMGYKVLQITPQQTGALIETRAALEPFLLRKAWPCIAQAESVGRIEAHLARSKADETVHTSVEDNWRRNIDFHLMLARYADNEYLLAMLAQTLKTCSRAAAQYFRDVRGIPHGDTDLHDEMMQAIRDGDFDRMLGALERDIRQLL